MMILLHVMLISPWIQYHLQPPHSVETRTTFLTMCYPLLFIVQGIDLPCGVENNKGIYPDHQRPSMYPAYWFQRMAIMLILSFWIFYLHWFFFLSDYYHANLTDRMVPHKYLICNWKDLKMAFDLLRWKALFEMVPEDAAGHYWNLIGIHMS